MAAVIGRNQLARLLEGWVAGLLPGPTFSCADALDDFLRISYAPPLPDVLRGLRRAADAWRAFTC